MKKKENKKAKLELEIIELESKIAPGTACNTTLFIDGTCVGGCAGSEC